jgi:hypothetical protein
VSERDGNQRAEGATVASRLGVAIHLPSSETILSTRWIELSELDANLGGKPRFFLPSRPEVAIHLQFVHGRANVIECHITRQERRADLWRENKPDHAVDEFLVELQRG